MNPRHVAVRTAIKKINGDFCSEKQRLRRKSKSSKSREIEIVTPVDRATQTTPVHKKDIRINIHDGKEVSAEVQKQALSDENRRILRAFLRKVIEAIHKVVMGLNSLAPSPTKLTVQETLHLLAIVASEHILSDVANSAKRHDAKFNTTKIISVLSKPCRRAKLNSSASFRRISLYSTLKEIAEKYTEEMIISSLREKGVSPRLAFHDQLFNFEAEWRITQAFIKDLLNAGVIASPELSKEEKKQRHETDEVDSLEELRTLRELHDYVVNVYRAEYINRLVMKGEEEVIHAIAAKLAMESGESERKIRMEAKQGKIKLFKFDKSEDPHSLSLRLREDVPILVHEFVDESNEWQENFERLDLPQNAGDFLKRWVLKTGTAPFAVLATLWKKSKGCGGHNSLIRSWGIFSMIGASIFDSRNLISTLSSFINFLQVHKKHLTRPLTRVLGSSLQWVMKVDIDIIALVQSSRKKLKDGTLSIADVREVLQLLRRALYEDAKDDTERKNGNTSNEHHDNGLRAVGHMIFHASDIALTYSEHGLQWLMSLENKENNIFRRNSKGDLIESKEDEKKESGRISLLGVESVDLNQISHLSRRWIQRGIALAGSQINAKAKYLSEHASQPGEEEKKIEVLGKEVMSFELLEKEKDFLDIKRLVHSLDDSRLPILTAIHACSVELFSQLFRKVATPYTGNLDVGIFEGCKNIKEAVLDAESILVRAAVKNLIDHPSADLLPDNIMKELTETKTLKELRFILKGINEEALKKAVARVVNKTASGETKATEHIKSSILRGSSKGIGEEAKEIHEFIIGILPPDVETLINEGVSRHAVLKMMAGALGITSGKLKESLKLNGSMNWSMAELAGVIKTSSDLLGDAGFVWAVDAGKLLVNAIDNIDGGLQRAMQSQEFKLPSASIDMQTLEAFSWHMLNTSVDKSLGKIEKKCGLKLDRTLIMNSLNGVQGKEKGINDSLNATQIAIEAKNRLLNCTITVLEETYNQTMGKRFGIPKELIIEKVGKCKSPKEVLKTMEKLTIEATAKTLEKSKDIMKKVKGFPKLFERLQRAQSLGVAADIVRDINLAAAADALRKMGGLAAEAPTPSWEEMQKIVSSDPGFQSVIENSILIKGMPDSLTDVFSEKLKGTDLWLLVEPVMKGKNRSPKELASTIMASEEFRNFLDSRLRPVMKLSSSMVDQFYGKTKGIALEAFEMAMMSISQRAGVGKNSSSLYFELIQKLMSEFASK
eukprot:CAMPEP_0167770340 /NCGR_PEP_ID=MMETSP0110_2-20121227/17871_1 /TAXON_ID=629695 /ORGANISM="Gymnochlora sp., Strain CCMP2014" /LENGTH=1232 /DNA_ID=CAMNT_0007659519 /DNA_START=675 /DNA_END=4373 /DNA_ORIENTATION=+